MLDLENLIRVYNNEKSTKKLLKYDPIVDEFNLRISQSDNKSVSSEISRAIEEIEIERIKYFIKEYILTRIDKLRQDFFLDVEMMSESEKLYYSQYLELCKQSNIYVDQQSKDVEIIGFVAKRELDGVKIDDEIVKIYNGDFFVANYEDIEAYIPDGSVQLV